MKIKSNILLLPGDGIGPEISNALKHIINSLEKVTHLEFNLDEDLIGGSSYDEHNEPITNRVIDKARQSDGVLLGAVGGDKYNELPFEKRPERGLLKLRKELDLFANIRPAKVFDALAEASSLKPEIVKGMNIIVLRELTGGIYFGEPRGIEDMKNGKRKGINTEVYHTDEITRLGRVGFEIALNRSGLIHSVDKSNVMESGLLWREEILKLKNSEYRQINLKNMYADNCAMQLVRNPKQFDVIVTGNLFGDILSDISAELTGSLGMLPSASLGKIRENNKRLSLYEPVHGSAPDIANKNIANPIAMILSFAMLLDYSLKEKEIALLLEKAVELVLNKGYRTQDIFKDKDKLVSTTDMGLLISQEIDHLAKNKDEI